MTYSEQLKYIDSVRLPLIIAVVFIHVQTFCVPHSMDWWFVKMLGEEIGRTGVPLFFAISGLLFFNGFSPSQGVSDILLAGSGKILRRLNTIVVPYLIWNLIQFLFFLLIGRAEIEDFLNAFWDMHSDGHWFFPVNGALWFLRELFIVSIFFPIIMCLVKFVKPCIGISLLVIISIMFDYKGIFPGTYNAFIYFTIGSYIGYHKIVVLDLCRKYKTMWFVFYSVMVVMDLKYFQEDKGFLYELHRMGFWVGSMFILGYTSFFPSKKWGCDLPGVAMFIFLSHSMLRLIPCTISNKYMVGYPILAYLFNIVITLIICITIYCLLRKYLSPKLFGLLTGGR